VAPIVDEHDGVILKSHGESLMVLFESATEAVRACIEILEACETSGQYKIKMGVSTGDVEVIGGDAFGKVVNLAARILSRAPPGAIWFSHATLMCMNQGEVPWESVGKFSFKGIPGEIAVQRTVPSHIVDLPETVTAAACENRLVRCKIGEPLAPIGSDSIVLLEGFEVASPELDEVLSQIPVVDPGSVWLLAYTIPQMARIEWQRAGHGLVVGTPDGLEASLAEAKSSEGLGVGTDTIIFENHQLGSVEVCIAGVAIPNVPLGEVISGFTVELLRNGKWAKRGELAIAELEVAPGTASLKPRVSGFTVEGARVRQGDVISLRDDTTIMTPVGEFRYLAFQGGRYRGILVGPAESSVYLREGTPLEIGREPAFPGLEIPDRTGAENIRWCSGARAAKARQSGFTLDRSMVGRKHITLAMLRGEVHAVTLHDRCPTYRVNGQHIERCHGPRPVLSGDYLVAGTSVVCVRDTKE